MKISVITVCYNSETTIARALSSVAEQAQADIEHIVVDGASTDRTVKIARQFEGRRCVIVSEPDKGIYDAMNKGLRRASGDVVCFLNADDFYASGSILHDVSQQMECQKLDLLLGDVSFFRADRPHESVRRFRSDRFSPRRLAWGWMPAHPAMFLRRSIYADLGGFKTDYQIAGDYEFVVRVFTRFEIHYQHIPRVMVQMQIGGASTRSLAATWKLNSEVLRACRENGLKTNFLKIMSKYPLKSMEYLRA